MGRLSLDELQVAEAHDEYSVLDAGVGEANGAVETKVVAADEAGGEDPVMAGVAFGADRERVGHPQGRRLEADEVFVRVVHHLDRLRAAHRVKGGTIERYPTVLGHRYIVFVGGGLRPAFVKNYPVFRHVDNCSGNDEMCQ